ncbi:hypothetical protein GLOIN_2v1778895 [Rhizophagus irregularis DAOM 181602=DAOM 197198]|uniref:Uncharacterized protein n=1 Tax=Rhizophagus irregularis (strain DAOM 181602 / DAOM 197198 / MUCL 43194) TaxID=747089 RepID=U9TBD2_RHIID|nr:hypothetical protein GLOIN_2v1778895 [Rhizophagus irregularis DAOM 181602=DAOM 197198]
MSPWNQESNSKRSGFLRNWKKGNEQDTLLSCEAQAKFKDLVSNNNCKSDSFSDNEPVNFPIINDVTELQLGPLPQKEFEEDAFLQEAVRKNKSDNVKTYAKNILKSVNTCDKLRKALKSERFKLRTSSNISNI